MKKGKSKVINALLLVGFLILLLAGANSAVYAQEGSFFLPELQPSLSEDGQTLYDAVPPLVVVVDPNPDMQGIKIAGPAAAEALAAPEAATATFSITYLAAGASDPWGAVCVDFPAGAKTAFNAAAAIWANTLKSSVPITINACWADLGSPSILGYSGGQPLRRDFTGAPKANTWYEGSLANSIAGSDLDVGEFDINITYNSGFSWHYGTDGNPPPGQYDLVTVAAHEIGHGLNFSGSATYSGGSGSFGYGTGFSNVYDTFMESLAGQTLTTYTNPSTALGTLLTSNNLWFNGTNANAANGGTRAKMYAPSTWASGSSYSHLDYATFGGTPNSMMVYAVASGSANHSPGVVTTGLLKDLGWQLATGTSTVPTPQSPSGTITNKTPTYRWTKVTSATKYRYQVLQGTTVIYTKTVASSACGASTCSSTPTTALDYLAYKWKVQAMVGGAWKAYSAFKTFTVKVPVPIPQTPSGTITDKTPTYEWTKVTGATQYHVQLVKGTTIVYTKTVASSACGTTTCTNTPTTALGLFTYKWKVQAQAGGVWSDYSAFETFTVQASIPTPQAPSGTTTDTTPTYTWTKVTGATQYSFQLLKGSTIVYTKTVASSACGTTTCTNTPTTALGLFTYKWKVQAQAGGVWSDYSALKTFTVSDPNAAKAGLWQQNPPNVEFYVTTNKVNVDNFAIVIDVTVGGVYCDTYKIKYNPTVPITNKNFSFNDTLSASGTFDTSTAAHGTTGLTNHPTPCGTVSGGPWNWTATWRNDSQPTIVVDGAAASVIAAPVSKGNGYFTVNID